MSYPKLIALEPWKVTNDVDKDFYSDVNLKFAKLFTAMSAVVPENGYILYAENNSDSTWGDHYHKFYDFWSIDLGLPTSSYTEIEKGLAYKTYEKGLIAYSRTKKNKAVQFMEGNPITIPSETGVFCTYKDSYFICE